VRGTFFPSPHADSSEGLNIILRVISTLTAMVGLRTTWRSELLPGLARSFLFFSFPFARA
jgi:hypothetical protein